MWYIYTMEYTYYSAIKRKAFESVLMRRMNLEPIIQSEVNQKEKDKYCILEISSRKLEIPREHFMQDGLNKGHKWYRPNRSRRY